MFTKSTHVGRIAMDDPWNVLGGRKPPKQYERTPGDWRSCIELDRAGQYVVVEDINTGEELIRPYFEVRG